LGNWVKIVVCSLFSLIFVLSFFSNAYAEITYSSINHRVNGPPSYCYVEPSDPEVSDIQKIDWGNEVEKSVKEWSDKLQASESVNKRLWEMKYLGSGDGPLPSCDYPIYFQSWPEESYDWFRVAGQFFFERLIKIYFLGWDYCEVDDELVQCFFWSMIYTGPQQGGTIKHEIGHSFGLDHYFTDSPDLQIKWEGLSVLPSVMISGINNYGDVKQVTDVDVQKVRDLYGSDGFYAFSRLEPPKPPTPEPILVPKTEPIIPTFPFERIDITSTIIEVDRYTTEMIKIIGDISEEEFLQGQRVYIILKKPDGSTETLKITPTRKGHFETTLVFDNDSMRGFYEVWAVYLEQRDRDMDIVFQVTTKAQKTSSPIEPTKTISSSSLTQEQKNIPSWIKEQGKWWAEGSISDNEFINSVQYMIKENIMVIPDLPEEVTQMELKDEKRAMGMEREQNVPDWVRNNAGWWADGLISEDDFLNGIKYLVEKGIIRI